MTAAHKIRCFAPSTAANSVGRKDNLISKLEWGGHIATKHPDSCDYAPGCRHKRQAVEVGQSMLTSLWGRAKQTPSATEEGATEEESTPPSGVGTSDIGPATCVRPHRRLRHWLRLWARQASGS